jgi:glycosyltransferase involved in cell wall biosynthesis
MSLRVDLQCHSRFSDRPHEWILRRIGAPQSYTSPAEVYRRLHEAGMGLKTITDHNRIEGCLEIADRPDVFLSEEVTTYFPDGCKIHLLVWNITEAQHRDIQELRPSITELSAYLRDKQIPHGIAHALVSINQQLTVEHFEKLILLFQIFEGRNGNREPLAQTVANLCLASLTPEKIVELANRHNLSPTHTDAHRKIFTGGSDDHGGLYLGRTFTEAPDARSRKAFFTELACGRVEAGGDLGSPLQLSSSLYTTSFQFIAQKLQSTAPLAARLLQNVAERFLAGKNPTAFSFGERVSLVVEGIRSGQAFEFVKPGENTLAVEFSNFFNDPLLQQSLEAIIKSEPNAERRSFRMAAHITNELTYRLLLQFQRRVQKGSLLDALQAVTGLLPVGGALLPYFVAFRQHEANRPLLQAAATRFLPEKPLVLRNEKRAWFTDTLEDVNGVARTIRAMTLAARQAGHDLTVVTSRSELTITDIPIQNFRPVGEFEIPEYELQKLSFPPVLEMLDYIQREGFTELIISTPGPVGLAALAAGKLLGLRLSSIYHTDFPQYARFLSDDAFMESMVWNYMQWFYGQFDLVYVNSEFYRRCWMERGFKPERLKILPRGLDTELFNPKHRDDHFWKSRGAKGPVLLYVGRISKEKELAILPEVVARLKKKVPPFTLALVGEGPYRAELQQLLPDAIFTGILTGRELGVAYASADLFVFPSTTDTFGNVVIEAQAAGLPVAVSDVGGPKELIQSPLQGCVLPARDVDAWVEGLVEMLARHPERSEREQMARAVHDERSWLRAAESFWADGLG